MTKNKASGLGLINLVFYVIIVVFALITTILLLVRCFLAVVSIMDLTEQLYTAKMFVAVIAPLTFLVGSLLIENELRRTCKK